MTKQQIYECQFYMMVHADLTRAGVNRLDEVLTRIEEVLAT